jgi:hypothetical protein
MRRSQTFSSRDIDRSARQQLRRFFTPTFNTPDASAAYDRTKKGSVGE